PPVPVVPPLLSEVEPWLEPPGELVETPPAHPVCKIRANATIRTAIPSRRLRRFPGNTTNPNGRIVANVINPFPCNAALVRAVVVMESHPVVMFPVSSVSKLHPVPVGSPEQDNCTCGSVPFVASSTYWYCALSPAFTVCGE